MRLDIVQLIGMVCAAIGAVSAVFYFVLRFKELRVLREIRDRLDKPRI